MNSIKVPEAIIDVPDATATVMSIFWVVPFVNVHDKEVAKFVTPVQVFVVAVTWDGNITRIYSPTFKAFDKVIENV